MALILVLGGLMWREAQAETTGVAVRSRQEASAGTLNEEGSKCRSDSRRPAPAACPHGDSPPRLPANTCQPLPSSSECD